MSRLAELMSKSEFSNWYADRRWRAKRDALLAREPLCRFCIARGRYTVATVADHIEPHRGDRWKFWNGEIQPLCARCHSSTKARIEHGQVAVDADGWPISDRLAARAAPDSHWKR